MGLLGLGRSGAQRHARSSHELCRFAPPSRDNMKSNPMCIRNRGLFFLVIFFLICSSQAAETPKTKWKVMSNPAQHGWSPEKMKAALDFAKASGSSALMVIEDG